MALEKARQERKGRGPNRTPGSQRHLESETESINYSNTSVTRISPEILLEQRVVASFPNDQRADIYRSLRTEVLKRLAENKHNSLAITSPNQDEGKSLTAVNLAVSIAMDVKHTALLVDLDLRKPSLHAYFGIQPTSGLRDYLVDESDLSEHLINPSIPRLVLLPAGRASNSSSETLQLPRMTRLTEELKSRYRDRVIIYDLPPLLSSPDAMAFLSQVDAVLLVIAEGMTKKDDVRRSMDLLVNYNVIGTILNKSAETRTSSYA